jgi:hypothetical protein
MRPMTGVAAQLKEGMNPGRRSQVPAGGGGELRLAGLVPFGTRVQEGGLVTGDASGTAIVVNGQVAVALAHFP